MKRLMVLVLVTVGLAWGQIGGIAGSVIDSSNGSPLAGAMVKVYGIRGHHPVPIATTVTQDDGSYEVIGLPDGAYFVQAREFGYYARFYQNGTSFRDADTVYVTDGQVTTDINIALPPRDGGQTGNAVIMGYVYDEQTGEPISRAFVFARKVRAAKHGPSHGRHYFTFTDENGHYVMDVDSGNYVVASFYWGHYPEWYDGASRPDSATVITLNVGDTLDNIDFTLLPFGAGYATATIQGIVTDSTTGEPIEGAVVRAISADTARRHGRHRHWFRGHGGAFDITDSTGSYSIDVFAPGTYILAAKAPMYYREFYDNVRRRDLATPVQVDSGDQLNIDFDLVPWATYGDATVAGTVIDETTGEPIPDAVVIAFVINDSTHRRRASVAVTDSMGNFLLENLPEGQPVILLGKAYGYRAEFYDDAHRPDSATVVIPSASGITIDLEPRSNLMGSGGISGFAYYENDPLAYGFVFARRLDDGTMFIDASDELGVYSLDDLPPGRYEVYALNSTGSKSSAIDTIEVLDSYVDHDIVVQPTSVEETAPIRPTALELSINRLASNQFTVSFSLPHEANVSLRLYDASGRLIENIYSGYLASGEHSFTWKVNRSSVYFVRLALEDGSVSVKKVVAFK